MTIERHHKDSGNDEEFDDRDVVCPYTGDEHTMEGPKATMCPSRDWIRQYLSELG